MEEFVCECGRKFDNKKSLYAHGTHCKQYKKKEKVSKYSKYRIDENLYCCECGREFSNFQSMNGHFGHCEEHCKTLGKETSHHHKGSMQWEKLSDEQIKEIHKRSGQTLSRKIANKECIPSFKGKTHTEESKYKMRKAKINYWKTVYSAYPGYNKSACTFINQLNEQNHWNLQHAENGGEIEICGYFLDGYDKELNIAFEYDEPKHYKDIYNNILREKDIKRQQKIISELNCTLYRYNEKLKLLYKVN